MIFINTEVSQLSGFQNMCLPSTLNIIHSEYYHIIKIPDHVLSFSTSQLLLEHTILQVNSYKRKNIVTKI